MHVLIEGGHGGGDACGSAADAHCHHSDFVSLPCVAVCTCGWVIDSGGHVGRHRAGGVFLAVVCAGCHYHGCCQCDVSYLFHIVVVFVFIVFGGLDANPSRLGLKYVPSPSLHRSK